VSQYQRNNHMTLVDMDISFRNVIAINVFRDNLSIR